MVGESKAPMPPSKEERGEIDTSLPFASVKAAVSLFGEKVDLQKPKIHEKRVMKDADLQYELIKIQEQLARAEKKKATALQELAEAKKLLEQMTEKAKVGNAPGESGTDGATTAAGQEVRKEQVIAHVEEKHVVWEAQSTAAPPNGDDEQHEAAYTDLERAKQELETLKAELLASEQERTAKLKQTDETLASLEANTQRAEELAKELAGINEQLVLLKLASIEANRDKVALLEAKRADKAREAVDGGSDLELATGELKKAELEHKRAAAMKELGELQAEIASSKEAEAKAAASAKEATAALEAVHLELERTKLSEESADSSLQSFSAEREELETKLKAELDNAATLAAVMESSQKELDMLTAELKSVKEREANATAAASVVTGELAAYKAKLPAALAAEAEAIESIAGLSQAYEQMKAEAAEAKSEAEAVQKEASRVKLEAEEAIAAKEKADSMLQNALQEATAAKEAEAAAIEHVKAVSAKAYAARASDVEAGAAITISKDEYDALERKVQEAEELANMRVAAIMAQVEAVRASEQEILRKVAIATEDMENIRKATAQALHRAEMAEAAKSAVEGELKRLRDREQKRRETSVSQQLYVRHGEDDGQPMPQKLAAPPRPPMRTNAEEGPKPLDRKDILKKKPFLGPIGSYLSKRKSFSGKP